MKLPSAWEKFVILLCCSNLMADTIQVTFLCSEIRPNLIV